MTDEQRQATIAKLEARLENATNDIEIRMLQSLIKMLRGDTGE